MTMSPRAHVPNGNLEAYKRTSRSGWRCVLNALVAVNKPLDKCEKVLDFGCGYGRVLRAIAAWLPEADITACDLNDDAIKFCAQTFGARPVQGYADLGKVKFPHKYDVIWVGSVFTHLPAEHWVLLIDFLSKNLAEDGVLVFSIHGRTALWVFENHTLEQSQMTSADFESVKRVYLENGYAYMNYSTGHVNSLSEIGIAVDQEAYGLSFTRSDWVCGFLQQFNDLFMVGYHEGGWSRNHDVVALWKPSDPRDSI